MTDITDVFDEMDIRSMELEQTARARYLDEIDYEYILDMLDTDDRIEFDLLQMIKHNKYSNKTLREKFETYLEWIDEDEVDNIRGYMVELLEQYSMTWSDFDRNDDDDEIADDDDDDDMDIAYGVITG